MAARQAALFLAVVALALGLAAPLGAQTQEITGIIGDSTSITTPPTAAVSFGNFAVGLNSVAGGSITVQSNVAYGVTVAADRAAMTEWDGNAYGDNALGTALTIVPTIAGGSPVPIASLGVGTSAATLFTGLGLTTDSVSLALHQTVLVADAPGTYRTVLTYTAAPTL